MAVILTSNLINWVFKPPAQNSINDSPMENRHTEYLKRFLSYQDDFMAYLYSMTGNREASLDIFQNAAVAIIEKDGLDSIRDFRAWSKEVVRRQALSFLRSEQRHRFNCRALEPELLDAISDVFVNGPGQASSGAEFESLSECFQELDESQKRLIDLRYGSDFSFEQIARTVDSTAGAVQRSIARIRAALRACVAGRLEMGS